jgi:hypothetical protein
MPCTNQNTKNGMPATTQGLVNYVLAVNNPREDVKKTPFGRKTRNRYVGNVRKK